MNSEIFLNSILLKFKEKKLEKKFNKNNFSEMRMLFVIGLVFCICFTNTIFLSNYNSAISNQNLFYKNIKEFTNSSNSNNTFNQNQISSKKFNLSSNDEFQLLSYSEDVISQIKNLNYFIFFFLSCLLFFRIIISIITYFKSETKENKKQLEPKKQNYDKILIKNPNNYDFIIKNKSIFKKNKDDEVNSENSKKFKINKKEFITKKLKFFLNLNLTISISIIYVYQFDVLKYLCAFYFENLNFYYILCFLEYLNLLYFIIFVFSDHIVITMGLFLAKSLK